MRPSWKTNHDRAGIILALIVACLVWGSSSTEPPDRSRADNPNRQMAKELSGLRIAVIADVHAGSPFI